MSIKDLGSGLNFKKKGLNQLINMILNNEISTLILNHKERLLRFGSEILFKLCDFYNIEVIILNEEVKDFNTDLTESVIEIMTVFCAKLYGKRSHKNNSPKIKTYVMSKETANAFQKRLYEFIIEQTECLLVGIGEVIWARLLLILEVKDRILGIVYTV